MLAEYEICIPDHQQYWTEKRYNWDTEAEYIHRVNDTRYRYAAILYGNDLAKFGEGYGYDFISIEGYATDDATDLAGLRDAWRGDVELINIWDFETKQFIGMGE